jgi:hypothetical protein
MWYVLFSYAFILIGQRFMCEYIFMEVYSSVPIFIRQNFVVCCYVCFDKLGGTAGGECLQNTDLGHIFHYIFLLLEPLV